MSFKIIFFVILTLTLISSEVLALSGDCIYETNEYTGYGCTVKFHEPDNITTFTQLGGSHLDGKTDDDVLGVWVYADMTTSKLPEYLCTKFINLQRLFFQRLVLKEIPQNTFVKCKNLEDLKLQSSLYSSKYITKFPTKLLAGNPKLKVFEAKLQKLRSLPFKFFENNLNLTRISLKDNKIKVLPTHIFKPLVNLKELILSKNIIQKVKPGYFETLENLDTLFLNDNQITDIPKNAFTALKNLNDLWISFNNIKTIHSDSFGQHPKLESINLMYNSINAIDEKFIDNIGIKHLQFFSNNCANEQFYDKDGDKTALKEGLKTCFENYQPRVDVVERVDVEEPETESTTPAVSMFDQVDGDEMLKNFMILFNQIKEEMDKQSTTTENTTM
ncbi:hypothetical protein ACKWTF_015800 [Chironomus riparius]